MSNHLFELWCENFWASGFWSIATILPYVPFVAWWPKWWDCWGIVWNNQSKGHIQGVCSKSTANSGHLWDFISTPPVLWWWLATGHSFVNSLNSYNSYSLNGDRWVLTISSHLEVDRHSRCRRCLAQLRSNFTTQDYLVLEIFRSDNWWFPTCHVAKFNQAIRLFFAYSTCAGIAAENRPYVCVVIEWNSWVVPISSDDFPAMFDDRRRSKICGPKQTFISTRRAYRRILWWSQQ